MRGEHQQRDLVFSCLARRASGSTQVNQPRQPTPDTSTSFQHTIICPVIPSVTSDPFGVGWREGEQAPNPKLQALCQQKTLQKASCCVVCPRHPALAPTTRGSVPTEHVIEYSARQTTIYRRCRPNSPQASTTPPAPHLQAHPKTPQLQTALPHHDRSHR